MNIYIGIIVLSLVLLYVFITYNILVNLKNSVSETFSTMDISLEKRWDLIPSLVEVVKKYAKNEKKIIEKVISLRNRIYNTMTMNDKISTNEELTKEIANLINLSEKYPELKKDNNFFILSKQLTTINYGIIDSSKYYNIAVKKMNKKVKRFPSILVAKIFRFKKLNIFETKINEHQN